jgi:hypothetical protein
VSVSLASHGRGRPHRGGGQLDPGRAAKRNAPGRLAPSGQRTLLAGRRVGLRGCVSRASGSRRPGGWGGGPLCVSLGRLDARSQWPHLVDCGRLRHSFGTSIAPQWWSRAGVVRVDP